jgi:serine/threonine-protein kinase RsbW
VDEFSDLGSSLHVVATLEALAQVRAYIRSTVTALGADTRTASALVQAVDEWVTNVVVHGYGGAPGPVEVTVQREGADIVIDVRDEAAAFDPATAPPFDRDVPLEKRPFGGMGIALINDLCAAFEHRALPGGGNEVTMRRPAQSVLSADVQRSAHDGGRV